MNSTIGKCCYCGQKAILAEGRELICDACGAPLTNFKAMSSMVKPVPMAMSKAPNRKVTKPVSASKSYKHKENKKPKYIETKKRSYPKRRRPLFRKFGEQFKDFIEDAVDEIKDVFD